MFDLCNLDVGVLEEEHEGNTYNQCVSCEDVPCGRPGCTLAYGCVNYHTGRKCTQGCAKTVGHEHEDTLCAGADAGVGLLLYVKGTGDVEEVECNTVNDAAEDEEEYAGKSGVPRPKKPNLNTHANIDISITTLMPNLFMKKGISRMQRVSDACEMDISALEFLTAKVPARLGSSANEPRNRFA